MDTQSSDTLILRSLLALKPRARIQDLNTGDVMFSSGDTGDCLYGVLEGRVGLSWQAVPLASCWVRVAVLSREPWFNKGTPTRARRLPWSRPS